MSSSHGGMLCEHAALFLFAHQRLVFRYPFSNPFEIVIVNNNGASSATGGSASHKGNSVHHGSATSGGAPVQIRSDSPSNSTTADNVGGLAAFSTPPLESSSIPNSSDPQQGGSAFGGSLAPLSLGGLVSSASLTGNGVAKMPTCVGVEIPTLLFMLRNSFRRLTTIQLGVGTCFVFPLRDVEGEATLVVIMKEMDDHYGHVTRFLQCYVNCLLREEERCKYVSRSIAAMVDALDNNPSSSGSLNRHQQQQQRATPPSHPSLLSPSCVVTQLTGVPELDCFSRLSCTVNSFFHELKLVAESVNGHYHDDISINNLIVLPHSHLSGYVRHRRQVVASFSSRFDPGAIITLADPQFTSTRTKQYEHVLGLTTAMLLPLDDVHATLRSLHTPWKLYDARSALEKVLRERIEQRQLTTSTSTATPQQGHHHASQRHAIASGRSHSGSGRAGSSGSTPTTPPPPNTIPHDDGTTVLTPLDAPFLVYEVIEFLRLFGSITIHIERLMFSHGNLSTFASSQVARGLMLGGSAGSCGRRESSSSWNRTPSGLTSDEAKADGSTKSSAVNSMLLPRVDTRCIFGVTCILCGVLSAAVDKEPSASLANATTCAKHNGGSHQQQHQLLYRHYNSQFDDPWFLVNDPLESKREWESQLAPNNSIPSIAVFQRYFEIDPERSRSAPDGVSSSKPDTNSVLSEAVVAPRKVGLFATEDTGLSSSQGITLSAESIPAPLSVWLHKHRDIIRQRIQLAVMDASSSGDSVGDSTTMHDQQPSWGSTGTGAPSESTTHAEGKPHISQGPSCSAVALREEFQREEMDSRGSVATRRFINFQHNGHRSSSAKIATPSKKLDNPCPSSPLTGGSDGATLATGKLPHAVLLQVVTHVVVALLWGQRNGLSLEDVSNQTEPILRRLGPMLRNHCYLAQRIEQIASNSNDDARSDQRKSKAQPLSPVELQIAKTESLMEKLGLLPILRPFAGYELSRISCRVLAHCAVNSIPDVVSVVYQPMKLPSAAAL